MSFDFSAEIHYQLVSQISAGILKDNEFLDLKQSLGLTSHSNPSMSGDKEIDYLTITGASNVTFSYQPTEQEQDNLKQLLLLKQNPIPVEILSEFSHMQASYVSGLLVEISRAWVAIDNTLYIWNYNDGSDATFYDGLADSIVAVSIVRPKEKTINKMAFEYLLVVCTVSDIVLLGLNLNKVASLEINYGENKDELVLHNDALFRISTDDCIFSCIQGTPNGRIFLGSKDSSFCEIDYRCNRGWFNQKRIWKINHSRSSMAFTIPLVPQFLSMTEDEPIKQLEFDETRNILYTCNEKGSVRVFDLGLNCDEMNRTATMSASTIYNNATSIARTVDRSNFKDITHMCVIKRSESQYLNFYLVTSTGIRLYFTTKAFNYSPNARPYMLALVHVRLPPGFASVSVARPVNAQKAIHVDGSVLICCPDNRDKEVLWCISKDSSNNQVPLQESFSCVDLDQVTWNLSETKVAVAQSENDMTNTLLGSSVRNCFVDQYHRPREQFVLLNGTSTLIIEKLRPVDQLRELLAENRVHDNEKLLHFFNSHKRQEACAMALLLATDSSTRFVHVADWALRAVILYGEEAHFISATASSSTILSPEMSIGVQDVSMNTRFSVAPLMRHSPRGKSSLGTFTHSHKFVGCLIFVSRIVRSFWEFSILKDEFSPGSKVSKVVFRWHGNEINAVLAKIKSFNQIVSKIFDPMLTQSAFSLESKSHLGMQADNTTTAEALRREFEAVNHLRMISTKIQELLAFLFIMADYYVNDVISNLNCALKQQMKELKFRDYIESDKSEMTSLFCVALFNKLICENVKIDTLCVKLREECPTIFSADDAICAQANDLLQAALRASNPDSQDSYLQESLVLFKKVAPLVDLNQVCAYYQQVNFCEGVIDLCICAAAKVDPMNLAVKFCCNLKPADDKIGRELFSGRQKCYQCVLNLIHYYFTIAENGGTDLHRSVSVLTQSSSIAANASNSGGATLVKDLTGHEARILFDYIIHECLSKDDQLLHFAVYQWLLEFELHDKILQNANSSLEQVLTSQVRTNSDKELFVAFELLWKYYEKNGLYEQAACILRTLAERPSCAVSLSQRVNFLGRALVTAKSCASGVIGHQAQIIKELEDKLEVGEVQLKVKNAISKLTTIAPEEREQVLSVLDSELFNLTQLYSDFACTYNLSECKLAIVAVAGHSDPKVVEFVWTELIDAIFKEAVALAGSVSSQSPSRSNSSSTFELISSRFSQAALQYADNQQFFPLPVIINHLEKRSCELQLGYKWIFRMFNEMGFSADTLLKTYIDLWRQKEKIWNILGYPLHLLNVADQLIQFFLQSFLASGDHKNEKKTTTTRGAGGGVYFFQLASDFMESEILSLMSLSAREEKYKTLIESFRKSVQRIEQITAN